MKKFIAPIAAGLVLIGTIGTLRAVDSDRSAKLMKVRAEIASANNAISALKAGESAAKYQIVKSETGIDPLRVEQDTKAIENLLHTVFTWRSYDEYMAARERIMKTYGVAKDSSFLTSFMPEIKDTVSPNGNHYNDIDIQGYNVELTGMKVYPLSVDNGYRYLVEVRTESHMKNGEGEGLMNAMCLITTVEAGHISEIYGTNVSSR